MGNIGYVHSTESFGASDGPGVRFIIFLAGCNMRCRYCHNPDTWDKKGEAVTADALLDKAERYKAYWGQSGGITVSGGEPMLQMDFLIELFQKAKQRGINTCLDTSGEPFSLSEPFLSKFKSLAAVTDLFLLDIKHFNEEKHIWLTGKSGQNIKEMLRQLDRQANKVRIRYVLVPTVNDNLEELEQLGALLKKFSSIERVEVLPYHTLGVFKWENLGYKYTLSDIAPPTAEQVKAATEILNK